MCWANSFILHKTKILSYMEIVESINITTKSESEVHERYMSGILYYLNNYKIDDIDHCNDNDYDFWTCDPINASASSYFVKRIQQKNENTIDN